MEGQVHKWQNRENLQKIVDPLELAITSWSFIGITLYVQALPHLQEGHLGHQLGQALEISETRQGPPSTAYALEFRLFTV